MPPSCSAHVATIRSSQSGSVTSAASHSAPPDLLGGRLQPGSSLRATMSTCAPFGDEPAARLEADALRGAGHDADLAVESQVHVTQAPTSPRDRLSRSS